jgi:ABC-type transporter lipoprotein component MlaA
MLSIWPLINSVVPLEKPHEDAHQTMDADSEFQTEDDAIDDFIRTVERFNKAVQDRYIKAPARLGGFDPEGPRHLDDE